MARNPALDGIRAIAAMLVLLHHTRVPGFGGGFIGVDIFFVLSGYLITGILLREAETTGGIAIGRFLLRRALRLFPPFALLLLAVLLIGPHVWPIEGLDLAVLIAGLYLTDYVAPIYGGLSILGHTWSLAVEEHFYLLWPFAVLALGGAARERRLRILLAAFAAATLWRLLNAWAFPDSFWFTGVRFDTRLSGLVLGAGLAVARPNLTRAVADRLGLASLLVLAGTTAIAAKDAIGAALLQPVIDIAAACLIAALTVETGRLSRLLSFGPIAYLGLISYAIYLWHYPISQAVQTFTSDWRIDLAITLPLTLALAALSYAFVEKPIQTWRRKRAAMG